MVIKCVGGIKADVSPFRAKRMAMAKARELLRNIGLTGVKR